MKQAVSLRLIKGGSEYSRPLLGDRLLPISPARRRYSIVRGIYILFCLSIGLGVLVWSVPLMLEAFRPGLPWEVRPLFILIGPVVAAIPTTLLLLPVPFVDAWRMYSESGDPLSLLELYRLFRLERAHRKIRQVA